MKEYYRQRTGTPPSKKSARTSHAENHKTLARYKGKRVQNLIVRGLQICLFLFVVAGTVLIVKNRHVMSSAPADQVSAGMEKRRIAEVQNAYKMWVKVGNDHLSTNELDQAQ